MKFIHIFLSFLLVLILVGMYLFFLLFEIKNKVTSPEERSSPRLEKIIQKINDFIYDKATEYNPKGDLVPDQIDDNIRQRIKGNP